MTGLGERLSIEQLMLTERPSGAALSVTVAATAPPAEWPPNRSQWIVIASAVFVILMALERRAATVAVEPGFSPGCDRSTRPAASGVVSRIVPAPGWESRKRTPEFSSNTMCSPLSVASTGAAMRARSIRRRAAAWSGPPASARPKRNVCLGSWFCSLGAMPLGLLLEPGAVRGARLRPALAIQRQTSSRRVIS